MKTYDTEWSDEKLVSADNCLRPEKCVSIDWVSKKWLCLSSGQFQEIRGALRTPGRVTT